MEEKKREKNLPCVKSIRWRKGLRVPFFFWKKKRKKKTYLASKNFCLRKFCSHKNQLLFRWRKGLRVHDLLFQYGHQNKKKREKKTYLASQNFCLRKFCSHKNQLPFRWRKGLRVHDLLTLIWASK